jgi:hypothetical protein
MPDAANLRIDRAMTNYTQGLGNGLFAAHKIFPQLTVDGSSGIYWIFDATRDLLRQTNDARAAGASANTIDYAMTQGTYVTKDHALDFVVPDEVVRDSTAPIQVFQSGVRKVRTKLLLNREIRAAAIMAAGVTNTSDPTHEWDDTTNGDIMADVQVARQSVRENTLGEEANECLMDAKVWDAVKLHPQIIARVAAGGNNNNPAQPFKNAVAMLFEVDEITVVSGFKNTAVEGQAASTSAIWGTDVYFWYQTATPGKEDASLAYSFTSSPTRVLRGRDGIAEADRVREGRHYVDKIVLAAAGYRLQNRIG